MRYLLVITLLLFATSLYAADMKITDLALDDSVDADTIFVCVDDPAGSATNEKVQFSGLESSIDHGNITGREDDDHTQYGQLADAETITGNWINTANPWADNEVSDTLTCSDLVAGSSVVADSEVDNDITINLAATATNLAANPTDCGANTWAQSIDASGDLTCAAVTEAGISDLNHLATSITDDIVTAADLDATNAEADDDIITYDLATGGFTFNSGPELCVAITGHADLCDGGDATGAGGSAITYDIGDDGGDDSTDVNEIATTGDTNSIFSEPSADKILIAVGNNWPTADAATALSANPSDCAANTFADAIDASGNLTCNGVVDADVANDITINSSAVITTAVGIDAIGDVDMDYGSVDVDDHTFITDGTGDGEIVLPAGSISGTEILDDTVDSDDYAATSIDNEHINWTDIDYLSDEGTVTGYTANRVAIMDSSGNLTDGPLVCYLEMTIDNPSSLTNADRKIPCGENRSGMDFVVTEMRAESNSTVSDAFTVYINPAHDYDDVTTIMEANANCDITSANEGLYYFELTSGIDNATIPDDNWLIFYWPTVTSHITWVRFSLWGYWE